MGKETKIKTVKKDKSEKVVSESKSAKQETGKQEKGIKPRLLERYERNIVPALKKKYNYKSNMQVPRLEKICVNMGIGKATQEPKLLDSAVQEMALITGQKPIITRSKKAISNFKLRENIAIGCKVTLRRAKMFEFMDRLITIALPRVRDFKGVSDKSFDGHGNYTLGIKEQIIFPEIDVDKITRIAGMDITFVTTAENDIEAYDLLKELGMPFVKRQEIIQTKDQS